MKHFVLCAVVGLICAITVNGSRADPLAPPSIDDSEWRFSLTPYAFVPVSVSGDSTVAGSTVALDLDLSDVLDLLKFAAAGRFEAWKGDYALILDSSYVALEAGGTVTVPGPFALSAAIDVDIVQFYQDVLASYRAIKKPYNANGDLWTLEIMGGARLNYLKQEIDVTISGGPGPGVARTLGGSETWIDPMLGARVSAMLGERWTVGVRGDIGGFGISDTDLTWSITGAFDYRPWEQTSLKFGLRYYSLDYETTASDGAFGFDVDEYGPYLGVTFNFQ